MEAGHDYTWQSWHRPRHHIHHSPALTSCQTTIVLQFRQIQNISGKSQILLCCVEQFLAERHIKYPDTSRCHHKFPTNLTFQFPARPPASRWSWTARTRCLSPGWRPSSPAGRSSSSRCTSGRWSTAGRGARGASRWRGV